MKKKVNFQNQNGEWITGHLDMPGNVEPVTTALFAHCFTCHKDLNAVKRITRALNEKGIAVLRFDFTGLGESEGDFSQTTFSHNVSDLLSACQFLKENGMQAEVLIGHSLGGAAIIFAAEKLDGVKAIVTIGAPSDPEHVSHLFSQQVEEIIENGEAMVDIAGRQFNVQKDFLEDLKGHNMKYVLNNLNCPLLIFHSPQDNVVSVNHATEIYKAARHPKSYISLDGADHLLTQKEDAVYVGEMVASWLGRYLTSKTKIEKMVQIPEAGVSAHLGSQGFATMVHDGRHQWLADEPESIGGDDLGPSPYDLLSASLATCTAMTLQMYSRRKKWDLSDVVVEVNHFKDHSENYVGEKNQELKIDHLHKKIRLIGNLDKSQVDRLLEIAERCPVNRTLKSEIHIETTSIHANPTF